eukprot:2934158-Rhodomonas_salina.3
MPETDAASAQHRTETSGHSQGQPRVSIRPRSNNPRFPSAYARAVRCPGLRCGLVPSGGQ